MLFSDDRETAKNNGMFIGISKKRHAKQQHTALPTGPGPADTGPAWCCFSTSAIREIWEEEAEGVGGKKKMGGRVGGDKAGGHNLSKGQVYIPGEPRCLVSNIVESPCHKTQFFFPRSYFPSTRT